MQIVVQFDIHVEAGSRFLQALHAVTRSMAVHPFVITVIGDNRIVTYRALVGQDRAVGGFARIDSFHIARDDVIDNARRIGTPDEYLFQWRHVEQAGSFANRVVFVIGIAVIAPGGAHTVPVFQARSQCSVA